MYYIGRRIHEEVSRFVGKKEGSKVRKLKESEKSIQDENKSTREI
jgi:hypothetical protein